ncbi:3-hydroxyacyl-CoA dehydrogenase NAD-binding domain-containing protein [Allomesorhizobium camelthorni]|uniref:Enoyl-CoA hydratase n=1 Tax=Allomesorhizobium camelthorni TaxID=475069 RepID=A0A6G4WFZ8_9HYPH|nr:enoyl-CoA hydratase [Mesorhizobium camelthorni]
MAVESGEEMAETVTFAREGALAVLSIDNPPVNALSRSVIEGLIAGFDLFEKDGSADGLIIRCAGRTFVAGGDIALFDDPAFSAEPLNALLDRIAASSRPVVGVLFGTVLGGGLELALACHGRIAAEGTAFGMPEIRLGLIPGSHGTQRLPRLVGLAEAARMISTGEAIGTEKALEIGLIDRIADPMDGAAIADFVGYVASRGRPEPAPLQGRADQEVLDGLRKTAAGKPQEPAYRAVAEALAAAIERPFAEGKAIEADWFARLVPSVPARAQRHLFFAERAAASIPDLPKESPTRSVEQVGILGAGTMGTGIALSFALAGFEVILSDTEQSAIDRAFEGLSDALGAFVRRGRLSDEAAKTTLARIEGAVGAAALASSDLVVEAVFEDMELKLAVARELGSLCNPGAIIATNTSTLDVNAIAAATGRPGDVIGTHFFSPAHIMRLLEVVRGKSTAPDVLQTILRTARRIGKTVVVSGVCYGFIGNRMAEVYMRESEAMQLEGASPQDIDRVIEDPAFLGMSMGPSRMLDMAGVDVGARTVIEWVASGAGPRDPAYRALCRRMYETGRHGQKSGLGYYLYEGRKALPDPDHSALCTGLAAELGIARRKHFPEEEIFERLFFPMVNEAALILEEKIAYRGSDIDVAWTSGYGFPRWRGGPLFMADEIGLARIVTGMEHYAARGGDSYGYWSVAPLLRRLAEEGGRISKWTSQGGRP